MEIFLQRESYQLYVTTSALSFFRSQLLLQRSDIDTTLKDNEGYTAFDLYNSTLVGTKPSLEDGDAYADLYTWGTNVCVHTIPSWLLTVN